MSDLDELIPSFDIYSFPSIESVSRKSIRGPKITLNMAWFSCPKCFLRDDIYRGEKFPMRYCPGRQPVEIEHEMIHAITGEKSSHKHQINCAHIPFEHFHVQCRICDYVFGLKMPGVK